MGKLSEERKNLLLITSLKISLKIHQQYFNDDFLDGMEKYFSNKLLQSRVSKKEFVFHYYGLIERIEKLPEDRKGKIALIILKEAINTRQFFLSDSNFEKFNVDINRILNRVIKNFEKEALFIFDKLIPE